MGHRLTFSIRMDSNQKSRRTSIVAIRGSRRRYCCVRAAGQTEDCDSMSSRNGKRNPLSVSVHAEVYKDRHVGGIVLRHQNRTSTDQRIEWPSSGEVLLDLAIETEHESFLGPASLEVGGKEEEADVCALYPADCR